MLLIGCAADTGSKIGDQVHVKAETVSGSVVMGETQKDFAELVRVEAMGDKAGQQQLLKTPRFTAIQVGTLVQVIDKGVADTIALRQIRILDGPRKGQSGWLAWNWLGP